MLDLDVESGFDTCCAVSFAVHLLSGFLLIDSLHLLFSPSGKGFDSVFCCAISTLGMEGMEAVASVVVSAEDLGNGFGCAVSTWGLSDVAGSGWGGLGYVSHCAVSGSWMSDTSDVPDVACDVVAWASKLIVDAVWGT